MTAYTLAEMQTRISAMDAALIDKNYTLPECDMTVQGSGEAVVWVKTYCDGDSRVFEGVYEETIEAAFDAADHYIANLPDMADLKKAEAVKKFGRAIDGLREAGIEADFVDPLSDVLQAMTENLLTHEQERQNG